jgi:hypothetical protein
MTTTTLYVSRRVRIPSFAATVAFDDLWATRDESGAQSPVVMPSAVLVWRGPYIVPGPDPTTPLRASIGWLRPSSGWGGFAVEVDLVPWSRREAEVGIRPRGRFGPFVEGRRQQRYVGLAGAMAEHLAARLEAVAARWERDVVTEATALLRTAVGI